MHDLVVTPKPVSDPLVDVVLVAALDSLRRHATGTVRIDHIAVNGADTEIERPAAEAMRLFWRFLAVDFGIVGSNDTSKLGPPGPEPAHAATIAAAQTIGKSAGIPCVIRM